MASSMSNALRNDEWSAPRAAQFQTAPRLSLIGLAISRQRFHARRLGESRRRQSVEATTYVAGHAREPARRALTCTFSTALTNHFHSLAVFVSTCVSPRDVQQFAS